MTTTVTDSVNFFQGNNPLELAKQYGSPLYVYNERLFREKCKAMKNLCKYPNFRVNYAIKANSNISLLKIAAQEGLCADLSSAGEIVIALEAGFTPKDLFFISNNISEEEMQFAISKNVLISVDSLSQLETFGRLSNGGKIAVRFNTGIGSGHHERVVTGGDNTKFGILTSYLPEVKELLTKYNLTLVGVNHHIGSQFAQELYVDGAKVLLEIAKQFDTLEFVDFGGGFYIPYHKQDGEKAFDLKPVGESLTNLMSEFSAQCGKEITCMIEPGRYISAECSVLLGTVHAVKTVGANNYAGTDVGFSIFARPTLYDSHHDIEIYRDGEISGDEVLVTIVGNQCESGDYIANKRLLPPLKEKDVLGVLDTGAYGFSMSSQYNQRLRPAEVLIREDDSVSLIRRRETYEDLLITMEGCY